MAAPKDLDIHLQLRQRLNYNPVTGVFTYALVSKGLRKAGDVAGYATAGGYLNIKFRRHWARLHRVAFLFTHGRWPIGEVDHINGDPADNRACNLREVRPSENQHNRKPTANKSGFPNVSKTRSGWVAHIQANGKRHYLGTHSSPELAFDAFVRAKKKYHPNGRIPTPSHQREDA